MNKPKYYRGHYLLAFYDQDDILRYVCDNVKEVASITGLSTNQWYSKLSHFFNKNKDRKYEYVWILGIRCTVHLIDINQDDD